MAHVLMIRARPATGESISHKHDAFLSRIIDLGPPWGPQSEEWPKAKDAGKNPMTVVSLQRLISFGTRASANYANRKYLRDDASADDWISVEFNAKQVNYSDLVTAVFPRYISAFRAYVASVEHCEFAIKDFERWRSTSKTGRDGVFRIHAVNFFDRELCRRAFALTPEQVVRKTSGRVERASVESDGALIIVTSRLLSFAEAAMIDAEFRPLLTER